MAANNVPILILAGFRELHDLDSFFRGKNLQKGRLLFEAGHVYEVRELLDSQGSEVTARCIPQTKINAPARCVKLSIDGRRRIFAGSCDCRAGIAGKCKHAAAVALYIQDGKCDSKTSHPRSWGVPASRKAYPRHSNVAFPKKEKGVSVRANEVPLNHVTQYFGDLNCPLIDMLSAEECMPAEPATTPPHSSPQSLVIFEWERIEKEFHSFTVMQCGNKILLKRVNLLERLSGPERRIYERYVAVSPEDVPDLSARTALGSLWANERFPRITATKAHRILTCCKSLSERAKSIVTEVPYNGYQVQYGLLKEPSARKAFEKKHDVNVAQFGLVVCPGEPWLACSPDGIFRDEDGSAVLLEIKCPFSRRQQSLTKRPLLKYLCGEDILDLRRSHSYFTQIQICLHVLGLQRCYFYVHTKVDSLTIHVKRNDEFLSSAVPKLRNFYFEHFLRALHECTDM
ncbi:uncharacterized protein LOC144109562 [Amblyomma americanum]